MPVHLVNTCIKEILNLVLGNAASPTCDMDRRDTHLDEVLNGMLIQ